MVEPNWNELSPTEKFRQAKVEIDCLRAELAAVDKQREDFFWDKQCAEAERDALMYNAESKYCAGMSAGFELGRNDDRAELSRIITQRWTEIADAKARAALAPSPAGPVCDVCNGTGQVSEWRPIETAPKDGTRFLAYWPHFGVSLVHRHDPGGIARNPQHHYECWVRDDNMPLGGEPSHWMPLPPSPAGREG